MKRLILFVCALYVGIGFSQTTSSNPDCGAAEPVCSDNGTSFDVGIGNGAVDDLPSGNSTSNPSTNPGAAGNSGCLFSGELNPNWFVINIGSDGVLEFTIGSAGSNGFFDWALWPYYENPNGTSACDDITGNTLAPVACNWNGSSAGFTGMYTQGSLPAGANQSNFEYAIPVQAGEQYVICFSNYSSLTGVNVPMTFGNDIPGNNNPNSATVACSAGTPNYTICLGNAADVTIVPPATFVNSTFNWLVTNGVSNTTGGTNVMVSPTVTTEYYVEIFDGSTASSTIDTFTVNVENPQNPNAGPDQNICLGDIINLAGVPADAANPVQWSFTAPTITPTPGVAFIPSANSANTIVNLNTAGSYHFILEETDPVCGPTTDTLDIEVSDLTITATAVDPSCQGYADGVINITAPGAAEWSFDGGTTWGTSPTSNVFTDGTYNVCAKTTLGCEKCTTVTVTDPAPVVISVSNDTLICQNGTGYLSASATGGTTYLFHWDHTNDTQAQQVVNPLVATTYTVYAENENGCTSQPTSIDVTVRPPLTGTISAWDTVCPTYSTDLTATVQGGLGTPYTFTWSTTDTQTGPDNHTITVTPGVTTTYSVTVTDECESTPLVLETNVRVSPLPEPRYEVLDPEQCEPAVFHIVNTTDPALSQYNYWWVEEKQEFVNQDTIVTDTMWAGQYDLQLIITSFEGCLDSIMINDALEVKPKPVANFFYSPNPVLMFNTEVHFTEHCVLGNTYQWYFEDGYPSSSTQTDVKVQFPDGVVGAYDVTLITTSELGCIDTTVQELIVYPEVLVYAPNTFTPDDDEYNQSWRVYMEGIDIYDFELLIFNRWGERIWESHDIEIPWDGTFNGKVVEAGTYQWIVRTKDALNDGRYTYNGHVTIIK